LHIWRSPLTGAVLLNCLGGRMPLFPLRSWGMLTAWGLRPLKPFLWIVISEDFASLVVQSLESSESQILSHTGGKTNRSEVSASATFWPN
jgi:hypothetical protein